MIKTYKVAILLPNETKEIDVTQISSMEFDKTFGFSGVVDWNISNVTKLVDKMIKPGFMDEFYQLMDKNRTWSNIYKNDLFVTLLDIHYENFDSQKKRLQPYLIFVKQEFSNSGFIDMPFLKKEWLEYEKVIEELEKA